MKSKATTVAAYLKELPAERRAVIAAVRKTIRAHLPRGYTEGMAWGMIGYEIPLNRFANTHNGKPLLYAALAAQKNNYAVYMMCVYTDPKSLTRLKDSYKKAGKRLDMGKGCVRFKKLEDLPLDVVGEIIGSMSVDEYLEHYKASRPGRAS
jgi:uncharacterized protein YdhG (YjbR/CyaY superfamily)